uniref:Uncharacterized protein n=1 Tax=Siphoviridae sp. ctnpt50 TaxID=2827941 RepID=A0A8S5SDS7_9CAUD|nr:MAG TPA: hypothetical protein [Siphoviridae sp. ctnpt50]
MEGLWGVQEVMREIVGDLLWKICLKSISF